MESYWVYKLHLRAAVGGNTNKFNVAFGGLGQGMLIILWLGLLCLPACLPSLLPSFLFSFISTLQHTGLGFVLLWDSHVRIYVSVLICVSWAFSLALFPPLVLFNSVFFLLFL